MLPVNKEGYREAGDEIIEFVYPKQKIKHKTGGNAINWLDETGTKPLKILDVKKKITFYVSNEKNIQKLQLSKA